MTSPDFVSAGEELDRMLLDIVYGPDSVRDGHDPYKEYSPSTRVADARKMLIFYTDVKLTITEPKALPDITDTEERRKRRPPWRAEFTASGDEDCYLDEDFYVVAEGQTEAEALTRAIIKLDQELKSEES
jgi:hypothetical protein